MASKESQWTVVDAQAPVLVCDYSFGKTGRANAFATRMADGRLVVLSPPCRMPEEGFADLLQYGEVGALVATNGFHHLGQAEWKQRFPSARSFAPPETSARLAKKNPAAGQFEPLSALAPLLGPSVNIREAPNTRCGETWAWVRSGDQVIWFVSDILANIPFLPGNLLIRAMFSLTGSAPGYRIFGLALGVIARNKKQLLRAMLADMETNPPTVVVPAHGAILRGGDVKERTFELVKSALK
jgi:hypothetical protein